MGDLPPIPEEFTSVIATRQYEITHDGVMDKIIVEIGLPVNDVECVDSTDWRCPIRITDGDKIVVCSAFGFDSYQALSLALNQLLRVRVELIARNKGAKVTLFDGDCEDVGILY